MVTAGILSFRENSHGRTGNRTRDLMISSQRLWPLDHEAGHVDKVKTLVCLIKCFYIEGFQIHIREALINIDKELLWTLVRDTKNILRRVEIRVFVYIKKQLLFLSVLQTHNLNNGRLTGLVTFCILQRVIEGKIKGGIEVTGRRGRKRRKLLADLKERRRYSELKEEALDRYWLTLRKGEDTQSWRRKL